MEALSAPRRRLVGPTGGVLLKPTGCGIPYPHYRISLWGVLVTASTSPALATALLVAVALGSVAVALWRNHRG